MQLTMDIFIHRDGKETGPYSPAEIQDRLAAGRLDESDMAWYEGAIDWLPLHKIRSVWSVPVARREEFSIVPAIPLQLEKVPPLPITITKDCPFCAEPINPKAVKCKHCGEVLDPKLRAAQEAQRAAEHRKGAVYVNQSVNVVGSKHSFPHVGHFLCR